MNEITKPTEFQQAVTKLEDYNDGNVDTQAEHRGITVKQKLKMGLGVLAVTAAVGGGANLVGNAVDANADSISAENGNTPELVQNQITENSIQTAVANGESPATAAEAYGSSAPESQYSDLQQSVEAQTAENAAQTANASGELPAN
jgi:hypothetical protein